MHKTQLYLEDSQYFLLRDWAQRKGKSMAQLVRELIDAALRQPVRKPHDSVYDLVGAADSGYANVSGNVDDYLYGSGEVVKNLERKGVVRDAGSRRKRKPR